MLSEIFKAIKQWVFTKTSTISEYLVRQNLVFMEINVRRLKSTKEKYLWYLSLCAERCKASTEIFTCSWLSYRGNGVTEIAVHDITFNRDSQKEF